MNAINLSSNLVRLRREKKITQEELADFIGVTKASVSKWENRQSMPDILLLPQLASYFGVTIDELMGYEAWLSPEQIRCCYRELAADFAGRPFEEVMRKTVNLAHQYYSCYPLLVQISILYLNHFMLAKTRERQMEILGEGDRLCDRVIENCMDVAVCGDAIAVKAMLKVYLGQPQEAIELLEPVADPAHLGEQNSMLLVQAYQMTGEKEKAKDQAQINLYLNMIYLVGMGTQLLNLCEDEEKRCEETIRRTEGIIKLYDLEHLHPNAASQFYYSEAVYYASKERNEASLEALQHFVKCVRVLLENPLLLHGDEYFDRLDGWIDRLPLGDQAPRDKAFARQSALEALNNPVFAGMREETAFKKICRGLSDESGYSDIS